MEVLLLQWTSSVVPPLLLALDFAVTFMVLAIVAAVALATARVVRRRRPVRPFPAAVLLTLAFYDLSRIHTEGIAWHDPTTLVLIGILALGCWRVSLPGTRGTVGDASDLMRLEVVIAATAAAWVILHLRGRFTPTVVVLALFGVVALVQVACTRWLFSRRQREPARPVLAALLPVIVCLVLAGVSYPLVPGFPRPEVHPRGRRTTAVRPSPNVIVIVMDTVRADHLSLYGYENPTSPYLAEFARGAYVFRRAIANSNWSLPSHATLLTGLLPHQHGAHTVIAALRRGAGGAMLGEVAQQPLASTHKTIADRLADLGYETGLIAANYAWLTDFSGLTNGFGYIENEPYSLVGWEPFCAAYLRHQPIESLAKLYKRNAVSKIPADEVVDFVFDFLEHAHGHPIFLLVNFMDAHGPYTSSLKAETIPELRNRLSRGHWTAANLEAYDRSIAFLDYQLGRLFAGLKASGLFDSSLIVVTADHGEEFGAQGRGWHGADLSQSSIHIPLLIKMPGQTTGETVDRLAQLADVAPTILHAVNVATPADFFGSALAERSRAVIAENYLGAGGSRAPVHMVSIEELDRRLPTQWALFQDRWELVRDERGRKSLYDFFDDPQGTRNLASRQPEITGEMGERLAALLPPGTFTDYWRPIPQASVSPLTLEKLKSLGYAQ